MGKFPLTTAVFVAGATAQAWRYDVIRFLPFAPVTMKSAPAAMRELAS
ncbi:MAG: hypothetical protein WA194_01230 [Patescibacteria group bacterium]